MSLRPSFLLVTSALLFCVSESAVRKLLAAEGDARDPIRLTHGPMLGGITSDSVKVWARTSDPGEFMVRFGTDANQLNQESSTGITAISRDNTGSLLLEGLKADTEYTIKFSERRPHGLPGSFRTLPARRSHCTRSSILRAYSIFDSKLALVRIRIRSTGVAIELLLTSISIEIGPTKCTSIL